MARHTFNFDGGGYLTTMGASWFISCSFYCYKDKTHINWQKVSTYRSRISILAYKLPKVLRVLCASVPWREIFGEISSHSLNKRNTANQ